MAAADEEPIIYIVEDDVSFRNALVRLFRTAGLHVKAFGSGTEFLRDNLPEIPSCLVLDVRLPGMNGLEVQSELAGANINIPVIFMSGHGSIPISVRAMKAGAIDFLPKPFRDHDMLDAVAMAVERDRQRLRQEGKIKSLHTLFDTLNAREREIMALVTTGLMNKQVAAKLGLSEITVKIYRGRVMKKVGAGSLAELVKISEALRNNSDRE